MDSIDIEKLKEVTGIFDMKELEISETPFCTEGMMDVDCMKSGNHCDQPCDGCPSLKTMKYVRIEGF